MRVALGATRRRNPSRLVLAVPVAAEDTLVRLRPEVNEVVCLQTPVGRHRFFYRDFHQLSDAEVSEFLALAAQPAESQ